MRGGGEQVFVLGEEQLREEEEFGLLVDEQAERIATDAIGRGLGADRPEPEGSWRSELEHALEDDGELAASDAQAGPRSALARAGGRLRPGSAARTALAAALAITASAVLLGALMIGRGGAPAPEASEGSSAASSPARVIASASPPLAGERRRLTASRREERRRNEKPRSRQGGGEHERTPKRMPDRSGQGEEASIAASTPAPAPTPQPAPALAPATAPAPTPTPSPAPAAEGGGCNPYDPTC